MATEVALVPLKNQRIRHFPYRFSSRVEPRGEGVFFRSLRLRFQAYQTHVGPDLQRWNCGRQVSHAH